MTRVNAGGRERRLFGERRGREGDWPGRWAGAGQEPHLGEVGGGRGFVLGVAAAADAALHTTPQRGRGGRAGEEVGYASGHASVTGL